MIFKFQWAEKFLAHALSHCSIQSVINEFIKVCFLRTFTILNQWKPSIPTNFREMSFWWIRWSISWKNPKFCSHRWSSRKQGFKVLSPINLSPKLQWNFQKLRKCWENSFVSSKCPKEKYLLSCDEHRRTDLDQHLNHQIE